VQQWGVNQYGALIWVIEPLKGMENAFFMGGGQAWGVLLPLKKGVLVRKNQNIHLWRIFCFSPRDCMESYSCLRIFMEKKNAKIFLEVRSYPNPVDGLSLFRSEFYDLVSAEPLTKNLASRAGAECGSACSGGGHAHSGGCATTGGVRYSGGSHRTENGRGHWSTGGDECTGNCLAKRHSLHGSGLLLGVSLGVAGAAFAVALPLASRWYPPEHQGTAMGIAGAGNSGTVLAVLLAPVLATAYGWQNVFGLALIPVGVAFILFVLFAKDAPNAAAPKRFADYTKALADKDAWWFMFFYMITFGGFSGFAGALPGYFADQFGFDLKTAGIYTAACVFSGSVMRPLGGVLADRIGGVKSLLVVYTAASVLIAMAGFNLGGAVGTTATFIIAMLFLGMGMALYSNWCRNASARRLG